MLQYLTGLLQRAYEIINPLYAQERRLARFEELEQSGRLEGMCSSEVHAIFEITKISKEM